MPPLQPPLLPSARDASPLGEGRGRARGAREWNKEEGSAVRSAIHYPNWSTVGRLDVGHVGLRIREILRRGSRDANKFADEPPRATNSSKPTAERGEGSIPYLSAHTPSRYLSAVSLSPIDYLPALTGENHRLIFPERRTKARRKPSVPRNATSIER